MAHVCRNISFATAGSFDAILRDGATVSVRGAETKELRNRVTTIQHPLERCVFLPGRNNDVFAQVAETFWVIGGRNDLPWLTRYLPRAPDFSDDDGATWHGAYGPRLRSWAGRIDQVDEWRRLLIAEPGTRRAVGVIFDPARDFTADRRDIPCNNWLSWLLRDGRLHLNVAVRSNDALWGFSGINAFEWSVLLEMMAHWVGASVGEAAFFATSYHLYARHYQRAAGIVRRFYGLTPYDFGLAPPRFMTRWNDFPEAMEDWFRIENLASANPDSQLPDGPALRDPLLASTLRLLRLRWGATQWTTDRLAAELAALPEDDFGAAAYEYFGRDRPQLLTTIPQSNIAAFFRACDSAKVAPPDDLKAAIKHLQARKNRSYAGSWKRRGERVSVLPNIARKVDRLQAFAQEGTILDGETTFDTAIDLYVYAVKYQLFLAEQAGAEMISPLDAHSPQPLSDHDANFNALVDEATFNAPQQADFGTHAEVIAKLFDSLWRAADAGASLGGRQRSAFELATAAAQLVGFIAATDRRSVGDLIRHERSS